MSKFRRQRSISNSSDDEPIASSRFTVTKRNDEDSIPPVTEVEEAEEEKAPSSENYEREGSSGSDSADSRIIASQNKEHASAKQKSRRRDSSSDSVSSFEKHDAEEDAENCDFPSSRQGRPIFARSDKEIEEEETRQNGGIEGASEAAMLALGKFILDNAKNFSQGLCKQTVLAGTVCKYVDSNTGELKYSTRNGIFRRVFLYAHPTTASSVVESCNETFSFKFNITGSCNKNEIDNRWGHSADLIHSGAVVGWEDKPLSSAAVGSKRPREVVVTSENLQVEKFETITPKAIPKPKEAKGGYAEGDSVPSPSTPIGSKARLSSRALVEALNDKTSKLSSEDPVSKLFVISKGLTTIDLIPPVFDIQQIQASIWGKPTQPVNFAAGASMLVPDFQKGEFVTIRALGGQFSSKKAAKSDAADKLVDILKNMWDQH